MLSKALATLVREMHWKTYTIIYENDDGLVRLQEVLKTHKGDDSPVTVKKLQPGTDHRFHTFFFFFHFKLLLYNVPGARGRSDVYSFARMEFTDEFITFIGNRTGKY